jgi:hypothetical protein
MPGRTSNLEPGAVRVFPNPRASRAIRILAATGSPGWGVVAHARRRDPHPSWNRYKQPWIFPFAHSAFPATC